MKPLTQLVAVGFLAVLACLINGAAAQNIPIEKDAIISDTKNFPRSKLLQLADPAAAMIRAMGWRCDSISSITPFIFSVGFTVVCNHFRYEYELKDRGGNWVVELL